MSIYPGILEYCLKKLFQICIRKVTEMKKTIYLAQASLSEDGRLVEITGREFYDIVTSVLGEKRYFVRLTDDIDYEGTEIIIEAPIKASNLMYSLYGPAGDRVGVSLSSCTMRTNSDGTYWTTFAIPESYVNKSGTYTLYFWAFDDAINLGWQSKTFKIDADAPTGSISLNDMTTGVDTDTAKNNNTLITAAPADAYSGIQSAYLYLYKGTQSNIGELVKTFNVSSSQNTFTEPVIFNFDASEYDDGEYVLKLDMTDKVGYTTTVYKDITIQNPIIRPVLGIDVSTGNSAVISWSFREGSDEQNPLVEIDKLHLLTICSRRKLFIQNITE